LVGLLLTQVFTYYLGGWLFVDR